MVVDELISLGSKFDRVSDPAPMPTMRDMYPADAKDFESRNEIINDVMEAIKDDKFNVIGVHGMGGIGKTTLVKEVAKKAEENKFFEEITPVVVVSQTPSIMKIQDEIAARLGLKLDEKDNEPTRAFHLRDRIMKVRSILVILDDLWAELELEDIGIPRPSVHKGCKILLTTREAWKLFNEKAGDDTIDSPDLLHIATKVAKECAGLPLAIVTVAGALMKIKDLSEWKDALRQLRNPSPKSIDGITAEVYKSLQLSYDSLKAEGLKECFLLCCQDPEDSNIRVSKLVRLAMGLRLFSGVCKFEEVRDAVRVSINKLKTRSLLLDGSTWFTISEREECVRMNDMVRDFAISIASESKGGIWARIDFGRSECSNYLPPLKDNDSTIGLQNKFHQLPAQIDCPKLNLILLEDYDQTRSTVLPEKLFNRTMELRVLSMVNMRIPTAPSLFQSLVNLQTLCLEGCKIEDLPCITELKGLEILSLSNSEITELSREIEQLSRLRILDLTNCTDLERIPAGVLSRLSQLEGLYMGGCAFNNWGEDDSASLDELKGLSYLNDLRMDLKNAEQFPQDIQLPKLSEFIFNLGVNILPFWRIIFEESIPKALTICEYDDKRITSHQGVKMFLNKAEYLILDRMEDVEGFLSDIKRKGFSRLKRLEIESDRTVEYLANNTKEGVMILPQHKVFPVLETLILRKMYNLKEICHGQLPAGSFCELRHLTLFRLDSLEDLWVVGNNASLPNLKKIHVHNCPKLKKLINIANGFGQQLHEIDIKYCHNLEEIFTYDDDDVGVEEETIPVHTMLDEIIMLPNLRILRLTRELPNLATFCSKRSRGILQQTFFHEKVLLPSLEELNIYDLKGIKEIWYIKLSSKSFCQLSILNVTRCDSLRNILTPSIVKDLSCLSKIYITECSSLEAILVDDENEEQRLVQVHDLQDKVIVFPHAILLSLKSLPNLKSFYSGSLTLEFPSLENFELGDCPRMQTFSLGLVVSPKPHCWITYNEEYEDEDEDEDEDDDEDEESEDFWKGDLNSSMQHLFQEKKQTYEDEDEDEDDEDEDDEDNFQEKVMASGSASMPIHERKGKKKYVPTEYTDQTIVIRDSDQHISSYAFRREVQPGPLEGHGSLAHGYDWYKLLPESVKNKVIAAGFGYFVILLQRSTNDLRRIMALAERWWDTTNSFHMPFGEMTMTPLDFSMITGLRFGGRPLEYIPDVQIYLAKVGELLGVVPEGVTISAKWLFDTFAGKTGFTDDQMTRAFILYVLGCSILSTRGDRVEVSLVWSLQHVDRIFEFNWGGAGLATLYRHMGEVSRSDYSSLGGFWWAWEIWSYEYLRMMAPTTDTNEAGVIPQGHKWRREATGKKVGAHSFIAFRNFLTNLREEHVIWTPWSTVMSRAPTYLLSSETVTRMRVLLSDGNSACQWYLGERVTRQSILAPEFYVPHPPPIGMRSAVLMVGDELAEALAGQDHFLFLSPPNGYPDFRSSRLMSNFPLMEDVRADGTQVLAGTRDQEMAAENQRMRSRVQYLEAELAHFRATGAPPGGTRAGGAGAGPSRTAAVADPGSNTDTDPLRRRVRRRRH